MRRFVYCACMLLLLSAYARGQEHPGLVRYSPTRMDWLVLMCQASLREDSLDKNGYMLEITASDPETVVISVTYTADANRQIMNMSIDTARKVINMDAKGYGWDKWLKIHENLELAK